MSKVVIIGGVAGGASCAARLRRNDEQCEIILFEKGPYISFANCGLPYHVSDVISSRDALLLQTPEAMMKKFNMMVHINHEVVAIHPNDRTLEVKNLSNGTTFTESYDTLVISTGSSPISPPIPGYESDRIHTLWTVPDTDIIRKKVQQGNIQRAAVIGGGFIGLEMAENLRHTGIDVSLIEQQNQVMTPLDFEMAQMVHQQLNEQGVRLYLNDGVKEFKEQPDSLQIVLQSGRVIETELVILSIGVKPNGALATKAGLQTNDRGGIVVNKYLKSSDPNIYAVGDVIEVNDFMLNEPTMIPLAGPANKQGRMVADNICGAQLPYDGTMGTAIAKVFELTVAATGVNEKTLLSKGLKKEIDYSSITISQNSHAGYYPGAQSMMIKVLFSLKDETILGAQIVGGEGVDKRIDTIAVAMRFGATVRQLPSLEMAYAPPFSSAKDPVNMAGFVAENVLNGKARIAEWDVVETNPNTTILDVREQSELDVVKIDKAKHIPLGSLRSRLDELNKADEIVVMCAAGIRAHNASRILQNNGFKNVSIYPGGMRFYCATHFEQFMQCANRVEISDSGRPLSSDDKEEDPTISVTLNCTGLQCPGPIMNVFETVHTMKEGEILEVIASDPGFLKDIHSWCRRTGNTLISTKKGSGEYRAKIQKGSASKTEALPSGQPHGKTLVVFSGDLDKVLASFIIANGSAAMGRPVTMFFTFWGLNVLRKEKKVPVKKSWMEKMFGAMMPRGMRKLKLSKMNMAGIGTSMMKKIMNDKNVDSLPSLVEKAMKAGVKIVACTMSMDVMGIREYELIDGVELGGVGAYLGDAEEADVNLFI